MAGVHQCESLLTYFIFFVSEDREHSVVEIINDDHFKKEMNNHPGKLIAVFYSTKKGLSISNSSVNIGTPASLYPDIVVMKVDVDKCLGTNESQDIKNRVPTLVFYRNVERIYTEKLYT